MQIVSLDKPQMMQVNWPRLGERFMLETVSDHRPREIHIEIQNPAYYLGIFKTMSLNSGSGSDANESLRIHEALREKNKVKVGIFIPELQRLIDQLPLKKQFSITILTAEEDWWKCLEGIADNEIEKIKNAAKKLLDDTLVKYSDYFELRNTAK